MNPNAIPPAGRGFQPGKSGNPGGRPKNALNKETIHKTVQRFFHMTVGELNSTVTNPESKVMDVVIGAVIQRAVKDGDYARLSFLLDRTIGKVREETSIDITSQDADAKLENVPREKLVAMVREYNAA